MGWYKNWRIERALNLIGIDLNKYPGSMTSIADQIKNSAADAQYLREKVGKLEKTADSLEKQISEERQEKESIKKNAREYTLKAKEKVIQLHRAYQEVIATILTGNKEISGETIKALGIQRALLRQNVEYKRRTFRLSDIVTMLSSGIVQYVAELLAETSSEFAKTPMMISLDYREPSAYHTYVSKTFKRICKVHSYFEAENLFKEDLELNQSLVSGKECRKDFEGFELSFVPYMLNKKSKVATIIYATPKKIKGKEMRHKVFNRLVERAQDKLAKFWHLYNKRIPEMQYLK